MRSFALAGPFFALSTVTYAQSQSIQMNTNTRDQINQGGLDIPKTGTLYGISGPAGKTIGDPYLDTTWQVGNVKFYGKILNTSDSLGGVPVRLDLMNHDVEIQAGANDIRSAKAPSVRYVVVNNKMGTTNQFINVREYRGEADALSGFFEQVSLGKMTLLEYPSIYVKRANFNAAMNTGSKDDELIKKFDWYVAHDGRAAKFSANKKAILELMADKKDQIDVFLKTEKPDLKSKSGLTKVFSYYNKL
ncbi:hypothetical protein IC230_20285 [Spirosoma sp. BT704]|uniref:DUF4369 domain-containing protein n=2 Tax=Spirosoma validum TaxID=2771355 RepID=A0A927B4R6_9BACT|nr:hypothetical protein [Spirosoma validum]